MKIIAAGSRIELFHDPGLFCLSGRALFIWPFGGIFEPQREVPWGIPILLFFGLWHGGSSKNFSIVLLFFYTEEQHFDGHVSSSFLSPLVFDVLTIVYFLQLCQLFLLPLSSSLLYQDLLRGNNHRRRLHIDIVIIFVIVNYRCNLPLVVNNIGLVFVHFSPDNLSNDSRSNKTSVTRSLNFIIIGCI